MKSLFYALFLAAIAPSALAADVGVSVSIGQPGFYGHIDIGDFPQPEVIYERPIIIHRVYERREPMYLHVPPGHARHWSKHCKRYHACDRPVYFVRDHWYNDVYAPRWRERHGDDRRHDRDDGWKDDHDRGDRGHGKGHKKDRD